MGIAPVEPYSYILLPTELQSDRSHSVVVDSDPGFEATNGFELLLCSSSIYSM